MHYLKATFDGLSETGKTVTVSVSGLSGGAFSFWQLVEHATSLFSLIGASAGAVVAVISAYLLIKKLIKNP